MTIALHDKICQLNLNGRSLTNMKILTSNRMHKAMTVVYMICQFHLILRYIIGQ